MPHPADAPDARRAATAPDVAEAPDAPDGPLDPALARAIIDAQRTRVRTTAYTDDRVIFGVWSVAWLVGYGVLWATSGDGVTAIPWWAWAVFGVLILSGVATTVLHSFFPLSSPSIFLLTLHSLITYC